MTLSSKRSVFDYNQVQHFSVWLSPCVKNKIGKKEKPLLACMSSKPQQKKKVKKNMFNFFHSKYPLSRSVHKLHDRHPRHTTPRRAARSVWASHAASRRRRDDAPPRQKRRRSSPKALHRWRPGMNRYESRRISPKFCRYFIQTNYISDIL